MSMSRGAATAPQGRAWRQMQRRSSGSGRGRGRGRGRREQRTRRNSLAAARHQGRSCSRVARGTAAVGGEQGIAIGPVPASPWDDETASPPLARQTQPIATQPVTPDDDNDTHADDDNAVPACPPASLPLSAPEAAPKLGAATALLAGCWLLPIHPPGVRVPAAVECR